MENHVTAAPLYYLGLETGGTKAVATILGPACRKLATREASRPEGATAQDTVIQLIGLAHAVQRDAGLSHPAQAVGWGFGGPVDRRHNRPAKNFHEPGWETLAPDPAMQLADALQAPVFVENDCNVAALAEAHLGAGATEGLTFYLTLGSGVGGGIVWHGRILDSGPMGEGEVGHMSLVEHGATCACGKRGCVEAYCSGWGVGERAMEAIQAASHPTRLMQSILAAEARDRAKLLFAAWPDDPFAAAQTDTFLNHLADACANVALLLAPRNFVIGGGLAQLPWLITELLPRIESRLPELMRGHIEVSVAQLGAASVSCGAALYARHRIEMIRDGRSR